MTCNINQVIRFESCNLRPALLLAAFFIAGLCLATRLDAQLYDASFADNGVAELDIGIGDYQSDMAVASDGSIYVLGSTMAGSNRNLMVARYLSTGELDPTFGGFGPTPDGVIVTDLSGDDYPGGVALQDDGKFLVVGYSENRETVLIRYNNDGLPDLTFGGLGFGEVDLSDQIPAFSQVDLQTPGFLGVAVVGDKIIVRNQLQVARFDTHGNVDPSFGIGGLVNLYPMVNGEATIRDMVVAEDKVYLFGRLYGVDGGPRFIALDQNGQPDSGFGINGVLTPPEGALQTLDSYASLVVHNGMITAAANDRIIRMDFTGMLDGNFNINGVVETFPFSEATDVILLPGGVIAASIKMPLAFDNKMAVIRLASDGQPIESFAHSTFGAATPGWFQADFGHAATAGKLFGYANGKILVSGDYRYDAIESQGDAGTNILLMRLKPSINGGPSLRPGHGSNGGLTTDPNRGSIQGRVGGFQAK